MILGDFGELGGGVRGGMPDCLTVFGKARWGGSWGCLGFLHAWVLFFVGGFVGVPGFSTCLGFIFRGGSNRLFPTAMLDQLKPSQANFAIIR